MPTEALPPPSPDPFAPPPPGGPDTPVGPTGPSEPSAPSAPPNIPIVTDVPEQLPDTEVPTIVPPDR